MSYYNQGGLPWHPPFTIQLDINPNLFRDFGAIITGIPMDYIIQSAPRTPMRSEFAGEFGANGFRNAPFHELVTTIGRALDRMGQNGDLNNANPEQVLQQLAPRVCDMFLALFTDRNAEKFRALLNPQAVNQARGLIGEYNALIQELNNPPRAMYGHAGGGHRPPDPYGVTNTGYAAGGHYAHNTATYGAPTHGNTGYSPGFDISNRAVHRAPADTGGKISMRYSAQAEDQRYDTPVEHVGGFRPAAVKPIEMTPGLNPNPVKEASPVKPAAALHDKFRPLPIAPVSEPAKPEVPVQAETGYTPGAGTYEPVVEEVQVEQPAPPVISGQLGDGQVELQLASQSTWTRTWTPTASHSLLYNPETHVKFFVQREVDGQKVVEELLMDRESMNYESHELSPLMQKMVKETQDVNRTERTVMPEWALAAHLKPLPDRALSLTQADLPTEGEGDDVKPIETPDRVTRSVLADSLARGISEVRLGSYQMIETAVAANRPYEFYLYLAHVIPGSVAEIKAIDAAGLQNRSTLMELWEGLDSLKRHEDVTDAAWRRLDRMATFMVMDLLHKSIGIDDWSIDSFHGDVEEVLQLVGDKYGADVKKVVLNAGSVITKTFATIDDPELFVEVAGDDSVDGEDARAIVYKEQVSVTVLPWDLDVVGFEGSSDARGRLVTVDTKAFHTFCRELIERLSTGEQDYAHHFIQTPSQTYELREGLLQEGSLLLFQVNDLT